jgi:hypothetical protein
MSRLVVIASRLLFVTLVPLSSARAAEAPSGEAEKVSQSALANARVLEVNGEIFMGDAIKTGRSGEAQIRFVDNTRMVVGPNARVTIDKFVFSGTTARSVTLNVAKGAFRFITGRSAKRAYSIRTPVIAVGVRGTGLDGYVEASGRTTIAVYEGAAEVCDRANRCVVLEAGCGIVVAAPGGGFQQPTTATQARFLPYSVSQASLLPQYRLDTSACRSRSASTPDIPAGSPILRTPNGSGNGTSADGPGRRGGGNNRGEGGGRGGNSGGGKDGGRDR